jgi:quercetin dioxygenase-like cupin family protein
MHRIRLCLVAFLVVAFGGIAAAQSTTKPTIVTPDNVHWTMGTGPLSGAQVAVLSGDPNKSGMYVMRLKLPANTKLSPHYHSSLENVTVISGTFYVGLGPKMIVSKMTALPAGTFVSVPAHVVHYAMTRAPAVIQLEGMGPMTMTASKGGM